MIYCVVTSARPCNKVGHLFWFTILTQQETGDVILYIIAYINTGNTFKLQIYKMKLKQISLNWINSMQEKKNFLLMSFLVHLDQRSMWTIAITWRPSSVVCKLFTFQASSPKPLGRLEPNLAGMFLGWSSTKLLFFLPVGYSIWLPRPIICSDWPKFQRSSSLKLMNWLNPNCTGMIIGMSFTKLLFFMPIGNPRWPPSQDID